MAGDQIPAIVAACTCINSFLTLVLSCFRYILLCTSSTPVRLAGFRLIEAGLPEDLDVDCQPSLSMCCVWDIERRPKRSYPGLVHMLQLASKTGATLAGKVLPFPRNWSHSPVTPCVTCFFWIVLFSDSGKYELASSVLTSAAKVRVVTARFTKLPVTHFHALIGSSLSNASEMQMTPKIFIGSL